MQSSFVLSAMLKSEIDADRECEERLMFKDQLKDCSKSFFKKFYDEGSTIVGLMGSLKIL